MSATAGYSGTPLAKKLGLKPGLHCLWLHEPVELWEALGALPADLTAHDTPQPGVAYDFVHLFLTEAATLEAEVRAVLPVLKKDGMLWLSWPKKAARKVVPSDIDENLLRAVLLPLGIVDVKVCAVTEVWSGLKFVWRKENR